VDPGTNADDVTAQPPADGQSKSKVWIVPVAIVGVVAVLAGAFFFLNREPATETLTVRLLVSDDFSGCDLGLGYIDVGGSNVIVEADGEIVATGELPNFGDEDSLACVFETLLFDVPSDKDFYELTIGRRGTQDSTLAELEDSGWVWEATLGL